MDKRMYGRMDRQTDTENGFIRSTQTSQLKTQMLSGLWHPQMLGWSKMQSLQVATTEF